MTQDREDDLISTSQIVFPTEVILDLRESLIDFMEPYKVFGQYEKFDYIYMRRVIQAISPALIHEATFELRLNQTMGNFLDTSLIYSDETYNPSLTSKNVEKLTRMLFCTLQMHGAYLNGFFPYMFYDLTNELAGVFRFVPELGQNII